MNIKHITLAGLILPPLLMVAPVWAVNLSNQTINSVQKNLKPAIQGNAVIKKTSPVSAIHSSTTQACPKMFVKGLRVVRVVPQPARGGVQTYRFILDGNIANRGATGVANAGLNVTQSVQGKPGKRIALKLFKKQVNKKQVLDVSRDLHVTIQSDALSRAQVSHTVFKMNVTNLRNERGACGEYNPTVSTLSAVQLSRALPAPVRGVSQQAGVITPTGKAPVGAGFGVPAVPVKRPLKIQKPVSDLHQPPLPGVKAGWPAPAKVHPVVTPPFSSMQTGKQKPVKRRNSFSPKVVPGGFGLNKPLAAVDGKSLLPPAAMSGSQHVLRDDHVPQPRPGGFAPVVAPGGALVSKAASTQKNSKSFKTQASAKPDRTAVAPLRIPELDKTLRHKLETARPMSYTVLTRQGAAATTAFNRQAWKGNILLPNLARQGKAIRIVPKGKKTGGAGQKAQWLLENPDGSLSKQIRDVNGRLAGNITVTGDGSVRVGIDLTGNQEADIYEMVSPDGEHSLLASPAGQAALDDFLNGGKNPLCDPAATAGQTGGGFAGGMISADDKTAMQVACGKDENRQGNGGSAAGGSGNVSGDPGGRATDAMCRDVLSRHRSRPGSPDRVMGDHEGSEVPVTEAFADSLVDFINNGFDGQEDSTAEQLARLIVSPLVAGPGVYFSFMTGDQAVAPTVRAVAERDPSILLKAVFPGGGVDTSIPDPNPRSERSNSSESTHENPSENSDSSNAANNSGACDRTTQSCPDESNAPNWVETNPESGRPDGSSSSDPGPDQQNDPDTALLAMCEARARSQAMRDAMTKDTSYVHQLCANPASQPGPAGNASSATLGGSYGSSITLATYCGQHGGQGTAAPTPERLAGQAGGGRNCGPTESPGADGQCHGVGRQYGLGNGRQVNVTYGAVIGFTPFNPAIDPSSEP